MVKKSRSNVSQAPENLLSRSQRAKNGTLNPDAPLTEMQRQFVVNLVDHRMTQTAAARAAGAAQPGSAAYEWMRHPKIERAIAKERLEYAKASAMTKQKVIEGFSEAINLARIKADPIAMVAGWREIGKMCGFYEATKAKIEVSVQGQVLIQRLNTMSDEELIALAEGDPTVLEGEFNVVDDVSPSP